MYDCANGHEFEIPMAAEADIPFTWECPRCGAESRQRDGSASPRPSTRSRRAPTGTCCSSVARSRSSKTSCPSASSCSAPARSVRRTCTAAEPRRRQPHDHEPNHHEQVDQDEEVGLTRRDQLEAQRFRGATWIPGGASVFVGTFVVRVIDLVDAPASRGGLSRYPTAAPRAWRSPHPALGAPVVG